MLDVLKAKKIAVIHDKDTYGQGLADATRAALAKRGTKEVLYEGCPAARRTSTRW
jgi:branched-chain amino acid transport system substrate-binding protein